MRVLVFGGTGNVGKPLVRTLLARGVKVRVVTHSQGGTHQIPEGVDVVTADFDRPDSLSGAFEQVDRVFLLVPMGPTETHRGLNALSAILAAKLEHFVYLSSDLAVRAPLIPHAGSKVGVEAAIRAGKIRYTILRPTYFAQNDLLLKDSLLSGSYPLPMGSRPIARVDVRDVAEVAVAALIDGKCPNQAVLISSPEQPNGEETARLWSRALGFPVAYPGLSPEDWAESVRKMLPNWLVSDLMSMYRQFQATGHPVAEEDLELQGELLSRPPRSYGEFVEECAEDWTKDQTPRHP